MIFFVQCNDVIMMAIFSFLPMILSEREWGGGRKIIGDRGEDREKERKRKMEE